MNRQIEGRVGGKGEDGMDCRTGHFGYNPPFIDIQFRRFASDLGSAGSIDALHRQGVTPIARAPDEREKGVENRGIVVAPVHAVQFDGAQMS